MDLTEAEDIKRWQKYGKNTQKNCTKQIFMTQIITCDHSPRARHPGIQSQVGLGSITMNKASGGDGIPVELFCILIDDAVKVLVSICQQTWETQKCHRTGKGKFSFQSLRKAMAKNAQTTAQLHSSHMLAK